MKTGSRKLSQKIPFQWDPASARGKRRGVMGLYKDIIRAIRNKAMRRVK